MNDKNKYWTKPTNKHNVEKEAKVLVIFEELAS